MSGIPVRFVLFLLRFYKTYLSILIAGSCRFEPTCSRYAYEAVERFGVMRGPWLAVRRLVRCQPLSGKFGYDPVPELWRGAGEKGARDGPRPLHVHGPDAAAQVEFVAGPNEAREFPQGLKPVESQPLLSELKLRPPSEPFEAQGELEKGAREGPRPLHVQEPSISNIVEVGSSDRVGFHKEAHS